MNVNTIMLCVISCNLLTSTQSFTIIIVITIVVEFHARPDPSFVAIMVLSFFPCDIIREPFWLGRSLRPFLLSVTFCVLLHGFTKKSFLINQEAGIK